MYLTRQAIRTIEFLYGDERFKTGASVVFFGMVREDSGPKKTLCLDYEAYEEMAERMIQELVHFSMDRWPLEEIKILHRLGRVWLGQIAVAIEVKSAHRDEAYQASRYLIEEIKHRVPIWKKEYFSDGTSGWSLCPSSASELSHEQMVEDKKENAHA